jgi:hypothetical protein
MTASRSRARMASARLSICRRMSASSVECSGPLVTEFTVAAPAPSGGTVLTSMPDLGSMMNTPSGEEACIEKVHAPAGARRHGGVGVDGRCDGRDAAGELGAMRERRMVGPEGQLVSARWARGPAMRPRPVVGPDGRHVPAGGCRATTVGMRRRPVVGPHGKRMPAAGCRTATPGLRQRLVVGSERQRLPSAIGTAGRVVTVVVTVEPALARDHLSRSAPVVS